MEFDFKKLENSRKSFRKLSNVLTEIYNDKSKVVYAFGRNENEILEQLEKEHGLTIENIVSIGYGGYIHKNDVKGFINLNKYIKGIKKEFTKDKYNACGLYLNRLWDYESRIGYDGYENSLNDLLYYMGLNSINDIDKELWEMLKITEKYYNKKFDEIN